MAAVRRLVLDLMKPHELTIVDVASAAADLGPGIDGVNAVLIETDRQVDNVKLTIEGDDVDFERVAETVGGLGGSLHSVDEVVCGGRLVEESPTSQG